MPFATMNEIQPKPIVVRLGPPPITEVASDMVWERPSQMSYYSAEVPSALMGMAEVGNLGMLSDYELDRLDKLPKSLVKLLALEAEDPAFVTGYLIPALHSRNPYKKITDDIAEQLYDEERGMGDLGKSFFKRIGSAIKRTVKKVVIDPHKRVFEAAKRIEKKVVRGVEKGWRKYGSIIVTVLGAALAPFTGGASLAAAAVIVAADTMYKKKKAADAAKAAARADAKLLAAEADKQERELQAQVDKFYNDNRAWFLQYDLGPDKWAKLTLQQKIDFINAGANGTLPPGMGPVQAPSEPVSSDTPTSTMPPGAITPPTGVPQTQGPTTGGAVMDRPSAPYGGQYVAGGSQGPTTGATYDSGGPEYGPPPGEAPVPAQASDGAPAGDYELLVEGQSAGKYTNLTAAVKDALANTQRGDRFEVLFNGKTTGLRIRTSTSSVEAPPGQEDKIRMMDHAQVVAVVDQAEAQSPASSGGIPWGLLAIGAGGLLALSGGK
jgi:hypothetical protein